MLNILIIDDQTMLRTGMRAMLETVSKHYYLYEASCVESALSILESNADIQVVISELKIGNRVVADIVETIKAVRTDVSILLYSGLAERLYALPVLRAGADGFIMKNAKIPELQNAIERIAAGGKYLNMELQASLIKNKSSHRLEDIESVEKLSPRELMVMREVAQGKSTKEIAYTLKLKCNTVSTYKKRICLKMNVADRIELAQKAAVL
ncbi:DNA-binding response regulator, NarL/FixJ family, contains REC and HTH domains [Dyadobacter sp. SG02]|uniref:response regulator transcription factor n=1 Tax=Dyadobacter sp. SG02 TaxID=1855291 RepID=UPI0008B6E8EE|nr:response regulator transcription factor [Dyadobacter sp. SG02]SEJ86209.1 DNA-binding response regulator, NarL/FixJ family, contains REC and HTH domains [Dyadobacter sp. SG02]